MSSRVFLLLVCAAMVSLCLAAAALAGPKDDYARGVGAFNSLLANEKRAGLRAEWEEVMKPFQASLAADSKGEYAPKCMFFLGRALEELARRFFVEADRKAALVAYDRLLKAFPKHSWADDTMYRKGLIWQEQAKNPARAAETFQALIKSYPQGDMVPKARERLAGQPTGQVASPPKNALPAPDAPRPQAAAPPKPSPAPQTASKAKSSTLLGIRHWSSQDSTRVVMDLSADVRYERTLVEKTVNGGKQLQITLQGAVVGADVQPERAIEEGILSRIRVGEGQPSGVLITFDLMNMTHYRVFTLSDPFRVVLDIYGGNDGGAQQARVEVPQSASLVLYPQGDMAPKTKEGLVGLPTGQKTLASDAPQPSKAPQAASQAKSSTLLGIRHWSSQDYTRVVMDLSADVRYERTLVEKTVRGGKQLQITLQGAVVGTDVKPERAIEDGILSHVRVEAGQPSGVLITLDLMNMDHYRVFTLPEPYRVVLDIYGSNGDGAPPVQATTPAETAKKPSDTGDEAPPVQATTPVETAKKPSGTGDEAPPVQATTPAETAKKPSDTGDEAPPVQASTPVETAKKPSGTGDEARPVQASTPVETAKKPSDTGDGVRPVQASTPAETAKKPSDTGDGVRPVQASTPAETAKKPSDADADVDHVQAALAELQTKKGQAQPKQSAQTELQTKKEQEQSEQAALAELKARKEQARQKQTAPADAGGAASGKAPVPAASVAAKDAPVKAPQLTVTPQQKKFSGSLVEQLGLKVRTIMIDAGHGGKDPGAVVHDVLEKNINLRMAKLLGGMLKEQGFEVHYTRTTDTSLPLEERTAMANAKNADLFISLHCNAHTDQSVKGLEVYYLNLATDAQSVRVAARENGVSAKNISDMQFILSDLMLNSKINESRQMAALVEKETLRTVRPKFAVTSHGSKGAFFYVLTGARMPSILVELGYLTNPGEAPKLNSEAYLTLMARGLSGGVLAYKKKLEQFALNSSGKS